MNHIDSRSQVLRQAQDLLDAGVATVPLETLVIRVGALERLSCTDDDDSPELSAIIDEALRLQGELVAAAAGLPVGGLPLPATDAVGRWLASPTGPFARALAQLDRLGVVTAGLAVLAPGSAAHQAALVADQSFSAQIQRAARSGGAAMVDAAEAAANLLVAGGVAAGSEQSILALSDILGDRIEAALRGEPVEAPALFRLAPIEADRALALGSALATALQRKQPLEVAPDLIELSGSVAWGAPRSGRDLVLHGAENQAVARRDVELLRDVKISVGEEEIEVELLGEEKGAALLVPMLDGHPGAPCAVRSGNHPGHLVFSLPTEGEKVDGYALVVGDRLAFLKR
jgi:hypothetical protein